MRGMNECGIRLSSVADHVNAPFVSVAIRDNGTGMGRTNELVGSTQTQCTSNILNNTVLPKCIDSNKKNIIKFLSELDEYYRLKNVLEPLKLPIAMKAVSDDYSIQWIATVYDDLADYSQFKKVFTDLLWSPQV
jgi:hypothetical protein